MLLLTGTGDLLRVITSAAGDIEIYAAHLDNNAGVITPNRTVTPSITTAATTTIVGSPGSGIQRNVKHINIFNNHASIANTVTVEVFDGTNAAELISLILLPAEVLTFNAEGAWKRYAANGAEYPPAGLGAFAGRTAGFLKIGTASDAVGYWYCTSKDSGFPGAWAPGTPGLNGRVTDGTAAADAGCFLIANPATGVNYLTAADIGASLAHLHMLFDVLWVNSGTVVTTTTAQAIASPAFPARDVNGSTNGEGLMIGLLVVAASTLAAVSSAATVSYTNSDGTAGRTATLAAIVGSQAPATPVIGTIVWFNLAAGDKGVRSIQNITLNISWLTGTLSLLVARPIKYVGNSVANLIGQPAGMIQLPGIRLYNNSCILHCNLASAATATLYCGDITVQEK